MAEPDIAIVGGGIVGCLIARELAARAPGASVTVLDRDAVGAGASRRSAGLHLPRGSSDRTRRMSAYSHAYYADLKRGDPGLPIHPLGATVVTRDGDGLIGRYLPLAAPAPSFAAPSSAAPSFAAPSFDALPLALPAGSRAWRITGGHYCDVYRLAQALAARLRPRVAFCEGVAVTGLVPGGDRVTVQCGTGARMAAGAVILAPGPWVAAPAWRDLLAPLGLRVKRVAALHIARKPGPADEAIMFDSDDAFLLPLAHRGHWLFSYCCREWDVDPDGPAAGLTAADVREARDTLRRYSPALADACRGGQVFCDAYGPDGEPVVRPLDPSGRIVFAGASGGSGYRLGPAIAAEAADLASRDLAGRDLPAHRTQGATGDHQYV
jgi:glycine/D-amino acid oxidase-like deaminating enzyme